MTQGYILTNSQLWRFQSGPFGAQPFVPVPDLVLLDHRPEERNWCVSQIKSDSLAETVNLKGSEISFPPPGEYQKYQTKVSWTRPKCDCFEVDLEHCFVTSEPALTFLELRI